MSETRTCRGTRIVRGPELLFQERLWSVLREQWRHLVIRGVVGRLEEIRLPTVEPAEAYPPEDREKNRMWEFADRGGRPVVLRPEGTQTVREMAHHELADESNVAIAYRCQCFRYDRPQFGRFREFTQFGLEVIRPKAASGEEVYASFLFALESVGLAGCQWVTIERGWGYYTGGVGFEIRHPAMGELAIGGGGPYAEGFGFALGVDRAWLATQQKAVHRGGAPRGESAEEGGDQGG